jgi:hypothetical protein
MRNALNVIIAWWGCPNRDALNAVELSIRQIIKRLEIASVEIVSLSWRASFGEDTGGA